MLRPAVEMTPRAARYPLAVAPHNGNGNGDCSDPPVISENQTGLVKGRNAFCGSVRRTKRDAYRWERGTGNPSAKAGAGSRGEMHSPKATGDLTSIIASSGSVMRRRLRWVTTTEPGWQCPSRWIGVCRFARENIAMPEKQRLTNGSGHTERNERV